MPPVFDYNNLTGRPSGPFVRLGALVIRGVRNVQKQIPPYAAAWRAHNVQALKDRGPVWVVIGDSMSQGIGATAYDHGWVGQLQGRLQQAGRHYRVINLSASGARIRDVLDVQLPLIEQLGLEPDLITVMIGSNDLVRKKYRLNAVADFAELVRRVPEGSVVANLLGNRAEPRRMDELLEQAAKECHLKIADMRHHGPTTWLGKTAEDRFHPNNAGYAAIADVFARALGL